MKTLSSDTSQFDYQGRDNLETMTHATKYNAFLSRLVREFAIGTETIDFGAGNGTFARPMSNAGLNVTCVEPDGNLRAELEQSELHVVSTLEQIEAQSIDYAYSLNVLEHIEDDRAQIVSLFRCLKPGGRLLLYVPAFNLLYSQMDHHVGHFRRYRRKPLRHVLHATGFDVRHASYVDSLGFLITLLYKVVGDRSGAISPRSVSIYDSMVFPLSRIVDFLSAGSFGKNLLIVADKPSDAAT